MGKILIISSTPPGWQGGGGVLIQSLMEGYGVDNFCVYCPTKVWENDKYYLPNSLKSIPIMFGPLRVFRLYKRRHKLLLFLEEIILFILLIRRKREILRFAKDNNVGIIWANLRGDTLFLVNYLHRKLNISMAASIQDPVESEWKDRKILYLIKKNNYYKAIKRAKSLAVAGESMVEFFKKEFNLESVIQRKGVAIDRNQLINHNEPFKDNIINIAFAGSIYTSEVFDSFLIALIQFLNIHQTYFVNFYLFSNDKINIKNHNRLKLILNSWETEENLHKIFLKMDFGYLPYKFSKKDKIQMQQSFPNKIIVYLKAYIPIFFHGPSYSSVNRFFDKYNCGVSCDSLHTEEIIRSLNSLVFDRELFLNYKKNCKIALEEEFDEQKIFEDFKYFINKATL